MAPLKVLIIGGGIAGNALAFWLSKLGHDITVVERFPTLRATGLQVDLRGHGIEVMKRMGLEDAFRAKSAPEQGVQIVDSTGRQRGYFPVNKSGKGLQSFTTDWEIMRGDFCQLMYHVTKDRAKYIFGTSVESLEEKDHTVEVRFTGGKVDHFNLVVGADGVRSRTRKMMLGPDTPDGLYPNNGLYVAYFTMPRVIQEAEEYIATVYMATQKRGIMTRRSHPDNIQVYIGGKDISDTLKNARQGVVSEEKDAIAKMFQGAGWQSEEIVEAMKDAPDFYCERMALVKLDSWHRGRVALVGDAAYCPTANTGMGTSSSVVGAYILAGEIGKYCGKDKAEGGLAIALKEYEHKFQPFMSQVQKGVLEDQKDSTWDFISSSRWGVAAMNYFVGIASFLKIDLGKYMVKEEVKGWVLPDYEELFKD